jgi:hypothetical protein
MENQLEKLVTSSQLRMLTGKYLNLNRVLYGDNRKDYVKNPKATLGQIHKSGLLGKSKSFDDRFDNKCILEQTLSTIIEKGISRNLFDKIVSQKTCVKKKKMVGLYSCLYDLLGHKDLCRIQNRLNSANEYFKNYGQMP